MDISIGLNLKDLSKFRTESVGTIENLAEIIIKDHYSLGTFKSNYRKAENFIQTRAIGLDFDSGMTLAQATEEFKDYKHIIAPTRSHQIEKDGVVADRFRVILILSSPITDLATYAVTWSTLYKKWPACDKQCKDASRFFYASKFIHSINKKGLRIDPVDPASIVVEPKEVTATTTSKSNSETSSKKGTLGYETKKFLADGKLAADCGRNQTIFKVTKDFQQAGYDNDGTLKMIMSALKLHNIIAPDFSEEEAVRTVESAFNTEAKHEARIKPNAFNWRSIDDIYDDNTKMEWAVDGLLMVGGLSVISADPKAGKSTVARQLVRSVLRGNKFLNRKCVQGAVYYLGMEEHVQVLNASFKRLGVRKGEPLFIHVGDILSEDGFGDFREALLEKRPALAIVDTMLDLIQVESENNYSEMKTKLRKLRQVARDSGTHIMCIHHNNKTGQNEMRKGNQRILGSQAISGGMDSILVIELDGKSRRITTSGREVVPWNRVNLLWDPKTCTYSISGIEELES